jgi:hypothetical protein
MPGGRPAKGKKTDSCYVCQKNQVDNGVSNFKGLNVTCNRRATEMKDINEETQTFYEIPRGNKYCSRCRGLLHNHMLDSKSIGEKPSKKYKNDKNHMERSSNKYDDLSANQSK